MKRKKVIVLITIGICLIIFGIILTIFFNLKSSHNYDDANRAYSAAASFKENKDKVYVEFIYKNENDKPVVIRTAKLNIYNSKSKESIHEEKLKVNKIVEPKKSIKIKFKEINKNIEELIDYYPDVSIN